MTISTPYPSIYPYVGDPVPSQPWIYPPNTSPSPPAHGGRWKCPDCGGWVARWLAVHFCNITSKTATGPTWISPLSGQTISVGSESTVALNNESPGD